MNRTPPRLRPLLLVALGLAALATAGTLRAEPEPTLKPTDVVYPHRPAATESVPNGPDHRSSSAVIIGLGLVLVATGGWVWWKYRAGPHGMNRGTQHLAIEETRALGNRQFLLVVTHEQRRFLLGVCPGRMEMLAELSAKPSGPSSS